MSTELSKLGPLAFLVGTWEGDDGEDLAPSNVDRADAISAYRERTVFDDIGAVDNHEQHLFGLRYHTVAWRRGADSPFHEDTGYWLWDEGASLVMKAFAVPRGITVLCGGTARPNDRVFTVKAELGSPTFGIASNPFLDREFQTTSFAATIEHLADGRLSIEQDTVLRMKGRIEPFHHTDRNVLKRV